jgi:hypothetical protein
MELHELQLTKDFQYGPDKSDVFSKDYVKPGAFVESLLYKYGWEVKGAGQEGAGAVHPKHPMLVLKVFSKTSAYKGFVDIVHKNSGNPYFPHISKYTRDIPNTQFSYVITEKLVPLDKTVLMTNYLPELIVLFYMTEKYKVVWLTGGTSSHDIMTSIDTCLVDSPHSYSDFMKNIKSRELWSCIGRSPPTDWFTACQLISATAASDSYRVDLHSNNFMLRGRRLVIIDPFISNRS